MRKYLLIGAGLGALAVAGVAMAQTPPGPGPGGPPPPPPAGDQGGPGRPGGPMGGPGWGGPMGMRGRMMMRSQSAGFIYRRGDTMFGVRCAANEPTQACVNAAGTLLDKLQPRGAGQ